MYTIGIIWQDLKHGLQGTPSFPEILIQLICAGVLRVCVSDELPVLPLPLETTCYVAAVQLFVYSVLWAPTKQEPCPAPGTVPDR